MPTTLIANFDNRSGVVFMAIACFLCLCGCRNLGRFLREKDHAMLRSSMVDFTGMILFAAMIAESAWLLVASGIPFIVMGFAVSIESAVNNLEASSKAGDKSRILKRQTLECGILAAFAMLFVVFGHYRYAAILGAIIVIHGLAIAYFRHRSNRQFTDAATRRWQTEYRQPNRE